MAPRPSRAIRHAWNAFFTESEQRVRSYGEYGSAYGSRPDRNRTFVANERSIIASIYTRIAVDVSMANISHVMLDEEKRYLRDINSGLNNCLTVEANLDQESTAFKRDYASTLFNRGVSAIVPVDTSINPEVSGSYDIQTMRIGQVVAWYPQHVRISLWNEAKGVRQEITLAKKVVGIVENPFYDVMNEPSSTLQRLIRKLNLLDTTDDKTASSKLDLLIQLPYVVKSETKREQAKQRQVDLEAQLAGSTYGIAYTDATEKITQLNRPAENNLLAQVQSLREQLFAELGLTPEVLAGTADEKTMLNYYSRTVQPIIDALTKEMKRKFLTKTARTQGQSIESFRDPFKLVPMENFAEIADKLTRNEVVSSNELRQFIGMKPSKDPKADQLRNANMPLPTDSPTEDKSQQPQDGEPAVNH